MMLLYVRCARIRQFTSFCHRIETATPIIIKNIKSSTVRTSAIICQNHYKLRIRLTRKAPFVIGGGALFGYSIAVGPGDDALYTDFIGREFGHSLLVRMVGRAHRCVKATGADFYNFRFYALAMRECRRNEYCESTS